MSNPAEPTVHAAAEAEELLLVQALQRGCDDAFARLVRQHGPQMFATARRLLGNEDDARDCLQEMFLSAFRSIGAFEAKSRLTTWLHRIVVNTALMKLRSRRCRPECGIEDLLPGFTDDGHHLEPPCPWSGQALLALQSAESQVLVRQAIDQLPPTYREVVVLRDIEGLSTEATARLLGATVNAVKIRLHRARQALRTMLDRRLEDLIS
ncbi:MAG TPA: sigma-70 family RNA polymerase sigma factor [Planctomycetota bacterium]|nr:sigma-70 family RNA polymerase sigma factor [Planctomycetota bacterium]